MFHINPTLTEHPFTGVVISNCIMLMFVMFVMFVESPKLHIILLPNTPNKNFLTQSYFPVNRQNDKLIDRHKTENITFPQTTYAGDKT